MRGKNERSEGRRKRKGKLLGQSMQVRDRSQTFGQHMALASVIAFFFTFTCLSFADDSFGKLIRFQPEFRQKVIGRTINLYDKAKTVERERERERERNKRIVLSLSRIIGLADDTENG